MHHSGHFGTLLTAAALWFPSALVRRAMYACAALTPLLPPTDVRRVPPPNVLDDVEPNPRGITCRGRGSDRRLLRQIA
jgi:hypothetical protein